jgi:hypothetical protein
MFDDQDKKAEKADYYAGPDGEMYRSRDFNKRFSPMWLLPILLIPLALLVWGGVQLLQNDNNAGTLARITSPTPAQKTGTQVGVGGGPDGKTSTPAAKATTRPTATATPKPTGKTEVGVGGGPDDPSVPSSPSTGHGW